MSIGSCFLMPLSVDLGLQDSQHFFFTLCGRLSLIDVLSSFPQVSMRHPSLEAHGLLRVHLSVIIPPSLLH